MLKQTSKLIIDRLRLVFLCCAPARPYCPLLCTPHCFILVAASSWLHFLFLCFFDFFCYSSTQRPRTYQELPGTHLGKLAKPSFPFNYFASGQISLKMLKVPYSNLIIRNGILRFNGAWMQKKKKKFGKARIKFRGFDFLHLSAHLFGSVLSFSIISLSEGLTSSLSLHHSSQHAS